MVLGLVFTNLSLNALYCSPIQSIIGPTTKVTNAKDKTIQHKTYIIFPFIKSILYLAFIAHVNYRSYLICGAVRVAFANDRAIDSTKGF
jgi:hypothetical protein